MRTLLFFIVFLNSTVLSAQFDLNSGTRPLSFYSDVMVSAIEAEHRSYASQMFYNAFKTYADSVNVYEADLSFLKTLSVLTHDEAEFKLISWQVEKASFVYEYHAFVVFEDGSYTELIQSPVIDNSIQYMSVDPGSWYGALYYNLMPLDKNRFVVFGYNAYGKYDHIKIADVLTINGKDVSLGAPIFEDRSEADSYMERIVLKYSSDASVNLNYNPGLKMIIMDHLEARMGRQEGQGTTMIPDGTYEGYEYVDNHWKYVEKIYDHSYGENNFPRPKPVLDKKKNLFGQ